MAPSRQSPSATTILRPGFRDARTAALVILALVLGAVLLTPAPVAAATSLRP